MVGSCGGLEHRQGWGAASFQGLFLPSVLVCPAYVCFVHLFIYLGNMTSFSNPFCINKELKR